MNNQQMIKILEDVINNVIDGESIRTLNKGIGTATPWGKSILSLLEMKKFLKSQVELSSKKVFDLDRLEAVKVRFKQPICEDDFPEKGMIAWFTAIETRSKYGCYELYFDFSDFEKENEKYFTSDYYDANGVPCLTAKEVGKYNPKYSIYFGDISWSIEENEKYLSECLEIIE